MEQNTENQQSVEKHMSNTDENGLRQMSYHT